MDRAPLRTKGMDSGSTTTRTVGSTWYMSQPPKMAEPSASTSTFDAKEFPPSVQTQRYCTEHERRVKDASPALSCPFVYSYLSAGRSEAKWTQSPAHRTPGLGDPCTPSLVHSVLSTPTIVSKGTHGAEINALLHENQLLRARVVFLEARLSESMNDTTFRGGTKMIVPSTPPRWALDVAQLYSLTPTPESVQEGRYPPMLSGSSCTAAHVMRQNYGRRLREKNMNIQPTFASKMVHNARLTTRGSTELESASSSGSTTEFMATGIQTMSEHHARDPCTISDPRRRLRSARSLSASLKRTVSERDLAIRKGFVNEELGAASASSHETSPIFNRKRRRFSVWTEDEERIFFDAYKVFGCKWKKIQESLPCKTRQQIQSHGSYLIKQGILTKFNSRNWTRRCPPSAR